MLDASTVFRCARVCSTYWSDATHPHTLDATPLSRHATLPQVPTYGVHERSEHGGLERVQRTFRTGCVRCSRQLSPQSPHWLSWGQDCDPPHSGAGGTEDWDKPAERSSPVATCPKIQLPNLATRMGRPPASLSSHKRNNPYLQDERSATQSDADPSTER